MQRSLARYVSNPTDPRNTLRDLSYLDAYLYNWAPLGRTYQQMTNELRRVGAASFREWYSNPFPGAAMGVEADSLATLRRETS